MHRKARSSVTARRSIDGRARVADSEYGPRSWRGVIGRPGWVDEIFEKEPRAAAFRDFMWRELGSTTVELEACDEEDAPETPREAELRQRIDRIVLREIVTDAEQEDPALRGSFSRVLQLLGSRDWYGAALFEHRWVADPAAHLGYRLELFHLHPSTIIDYDEDEEEHPGRLLGVRQQTRRGSSTILGDALLAFPYGSFDGEWEGWTRWRSIGMWVEAKWQSLVSYSVMLRRSGGILAVQELNDAGVDRIAREDVEQFLDQAEEGTAMAGFLPRGAEAKFLAFSGGSNSAANPAEFWKYVDQQIDHLNHQHADSLGAVSGSGSRALGETFVIKEQAKWNAFVNELLADLSRALFPIIARDLGYGDCRLPKLSTEVEAIQVSPAERRERIERAVQLGLYPKTPELTRWLATDDGLDEDVIAATVAAVATTGAPLVGGRSGAPTPPGVLPPGAPDPQVPPQPLRFSEDDPADDGLIEVRDANGATYRTHEPLTDLELTVAWDDMDNKRDDADRQMVERVSVLVDQHRQDLVTVMDDGTDEGLSETEIDNTIRLVRFEYVPRYRDAIRDYVLEVEQMQESQATDEMQRQVRSGQARAEGERTPAPGPRELQEMRQALGETALGQIEALDRLVDRTAQALARRVEGELVSGWGSTLLATRARDIKPFLTHKQLAAPVRALGNRAEQAGRLIVATLGSEAASLWVVGAQRSSVRDKRRCKRCEKLHRRTWQLRTVAQVKAFADDPDAVFPDPQCDGKDNCRCGLIPRYAQLPPERAEGTPPPRLNTPSGDLQLSELRAAYTSGPRTVAGLVEGWRTLRAAESRNGAPFRRSEPRAQS